MLVVCLIWYWLFHDVIITHHCQQTYLDADKVELTLSKGESLFDGSSKPCNDIHVVHKGEVEVYDCASHVQLALLPPGACLSSLLALVNYLTGVCACLHLYLHSCI